jgi:hypothetical protein
MFWSPENLVDWLATIDVDYGIQYGINVIDAEINGKYLGIFGRLEVVNEFGIEKLFKC